MYDVAVQQSFKYEGHQKIFHIPSDMCLSEGKIWTGFCMILPANMGRSLFQCSLEPLHWVFKSGTSMDFCSKSSPPECPTHRSSPSEGIAAKTCGGLRQPAELEIDCFGDHKSSKYRGWLRNHQLMSGLSGICFNHPVGNAGFRNHPPSAYLASGLPACSGTHCPPPAQPANWSGHSLDAHNPQLKRDKPLGSMIHIPSGKKYIELLVYRRVWLFIILKQ